MTAHYEVRADVALIRLDNAPLNGLDLATRREAVAALERAQNDPAVRAVVLTGVGRAFSSGADIKEFASGTGFRPPDLRSVIAAFEAATKPVVAALHGVAMGGGLELALGCHWRIAAPGCDVALPEVKLGLVPGAGGTQRLPRALGVEPALNLIVGGKAVKSEQLAQVPGQRLFDRMAATADSLLDEAVVLAREAAGAQARGEPLPRLRDRPCGHPRGEAYFQFARKAIGGQGPLQRAPLACVALVEAAATQPFDDGLALELQTFLDLMNTPQSRALRHAFFAERAAARIPGLPAGTPQREVHRVGVVGSGTMGSGIAICFLDAGIPVTLLDSRQEALDRATGSIRKIYEGQAAKGRLKPGQVDERMARLTTTLSYADLAAADLAIEAVFEDMPIKQAVFEQLDAVLRPGAILASNTSSLDLDRIARFTRRPQDVVGLHFFSPANVMRLLEVVRGARTAPEVLATAMALGKRIRKTCVVSGVCDGFIGNRMLAPYLRQAGFLLDEGCTPQQVDRAVERFGMAMGPFRMSDMAGNDIGWAIRKRHYAERPELRYSASADRLCELGRLGQKTGAGWYDYVPGQRDPRPSAVVEDMLAAHRAGLGIAPRRIDDSEIVQRLVYALVNEGARILEEGIAARAGDIDVVYLSGYGFPAWRGGPMRYADEVGLFDVAAAMKRFARNPLDDATFWQPAALLERLAETGEGFPG